MSCELMNMREESLGSRFDRLMKIVETLSRPGGVSVRELARITGVDVRTIQRDLQFLIDRRFEIVQERRKGPYRLIRLPHPFGLEEMPG